MKALAFIVLIIFIIFLLPTIYEAIREICEAIGESIFKILWKINVKGMNHDKNNM